MSWRQVHAIAVHPDKHTHLVEVSDGRIPEQVLGFGDAKVAVNHQHVHGERRHLRYARRSGQRRSVLIGAITIGRV